MTELTAKERRAAQLWAEMRGLVEHEDELINKRVVWMFTLNGFLFAAIGLSMSAEASILTGSCADRAACDILIGQIELMRAAVALIGGFSAFSSLSGVVAAESAIRSAVSRYQQVREQEGLGPSVFQPVGAKRTHLFGASPGVWFPILLTGTWVTFLVWTGTEGRTLTLGYDQEVVPMTVVAAPLGIVVMLLLRAMTLSQFDANAKQDKEQFQMNGKKKDV